MIKILALFVMLNSIVFASAIPEVVGIFKDGIQIDRGSSQGVGNSTEGRIYFIENISGKSVKIFIAKFKVKAIEKDSCRAAILKSTKEIALGYKVEFNEISDKNERSEEQFWAAIKNSKKINDFYSYLGKYPNGSFSESAKKRIEEIKKESQDSFEIVFWDSIKSSENKEDFSAYLKKFPQGMFSEVAKNRILEIESGQSQKQEVLFSQYYDDSYAALLKGDLESADSSCRRALRIKNTKELEQLRREIDAQKSSLLRRKKFNALKIGSVLDLKQEQIQKYKNELSEIAINNDGLYEVDVSGSICLSLFVDGEGFFYVDDLFASKLNVQPNDKKDLLCYMIKKKVSSLKGDPPLNGTGGPIQVAGWRIDYQVKNENGALSLAANPVITLQ